MSGRAGGQPSPTNDRGPDGALWFTEPATDMLGRIVGD
ncbi:hypothetical protein J2S58_002096 [Nakamurella flavida]|nr:hypothetical protein [Nakamurella flavida]